MNEVNNDNTVAATPTKRFFTDMLTRDIELQDAILDLLDNCVDGIQRSQKGALNNENPYQGYWATITFDDKHFEISDNCGGIPYALAKKYAFMMGRPRDEDDTDIPTVGMYGIGMKRAIFKMGQSSKVTSQTEKEIFEVEISPKWLTDDSDWNLPLKFIEKPFEQSGTLIRVEKLHKNVAKVFSTDGTSNLEENLITLVGHQFGFIIKKGFSVKINGNTVIPRSLTLLWSDKSTPEGQGITPYLYKSNKDGVDISLAVGFYSPMLGDDEIEEEQVTRRSREDAGWTIMCNDRVVVYNDKSRLTGWGEAGVPGYHSQFIGIYGVVSFNSNDAWRLPVTTTKRGVDTSSEIYLYIKDFMREGLKKFTDYTNHWKNHRQDEKKISLSAASVDIEKVLASSPDDKWTKVQNRNNERKLNAPLARPAGDKQTRQVKFTKQISEIDFVANFLFGSTDVKPGEVGEECFDKIFRIAESKK